MKHRYLKNVTTLKMDQSRCTGCGKCIEVCPHQVFTIIDRKSSIIDKDSCIECGACVKNCSFHALAVKPGVGCATAIIKSWFNGGEVSCDSSASSGGCC